MLTVTTIPTSGDNYMYLVEDTKQKVAAIVDPLEPQNVMKVVKERGVTLQSIMTTHHHWDHAGGNEKMLASVPGMTVYGGDERVNALSKKVKQDDVFNIGSLKVSCLFTPCHTTGHICYYVTDDDGNKAVFTGDTLFVAGCGRFFEGTPNEMHDALLNKLGSLPGDTGVYCGHEYTVKNLKFAASVEPGNTAVKDKLQWAEAALAQKKFTVPSSIDDEKRTNPFMRVNEPDIQKHLGSSDPIDTMAKLRQAKDKF